VAKLSTDGAGAADGAILAELAGVGVAGLTGL
jgi:hypothetical protein